MKILAFVFSLTFLANAYSQTEPVLKITCYPDLQESLTVTCADESCELLTFKRIYRDGQRTRSISREQLASMSIQRGPRKVVNEDYYRPYKLTRDYAKDIKDSVDRGYIGTAIGASVVFPFLVAIDSVGLVATPFIYLSNTENVSKHHAKAAKKMIEYLSENNNEVLMKEKHFYRLVAGLKL